MLNLHLKIILTNHYHFDMIKTGDKIIIHENKVKVVFGIHENGNPLVKNHGTIVQVDKNKCKKW